MIELEWAPERMNLGVNSYGRAENSIVGRSDSGADPVRHEFAAIACAEEDGGYSVFALNYPGVVSQGDTLEEAKANIAEAFLGMLEARRKHGEGMSYSYQPVIDVAGCVRVWISVDG